MVTPWKPTRSQLINAAGKSVPDVIGPGLRVLFCGINPGLYSAAVGHHFARPGNRFWPVLYASGFTESLLSPFDERELLKCGLGITNVVRSATASAAELTKKDLLVGGKRLAAKVRRFKPRFLAVLGLGAYRTAFRCPTAAVGKQDLTIDATVLWVLPNPSGLNAHYQPAELARLFSQLRAEVGKTTAL